MVMSCNSTTTTTPTRSNSSYCALSAVRLNLGGFYGATLKPLSDDNLTSGAVNVVVFDSPVLLPVGTDYPYSRQSAEHLQRIKSTV